jgi:NAD(P)-dependent dehydrogenase (short-subunit alcohol dehydrogenase family)
LKGNKNILQKVKGEFVLLKRNELVMLSSTKKVVIVTGAAAGMGKAIASALVKNNYNVFLFDKNEQQLIQIAENDLPAGRADFSCGDVTKKADVEKALEHCINTFDCIDALVSNVGVIEKLDFLEMTEQDWDRSINVNLKGAFLWGQAVSKWLVKNKCAGSIVNIGCMRASLVTKGMAPYAAAKAGIRMLTKAMAVELAPYKINVNAVEPGRTLTDGLRRHMVDNQAVAARLRQIPLGRFAEAADIASTVMFLLSPAAKYITGAAIPVDGGYSIAKE